MLQGVGEHRSFRTRGFPGDPGRLLLSTLGSSVVISVNRGVTGANIINATTFYPAKCDARIILNVPMTNSGVAPSLP